MSEIDEAKIVSEIQMQPRFNSMDDGLIKLAFSDAALTVSAFELPKSIQAQAVRLYACHLLLVRDIADSGYQSETMGPLSHTSFDWSKDNDPYLNEFNKLLSTYGFGSNKAKFI